MRSITFEFWYGKIIREEKNTKLTKYTKKASLFVWYLYFNKKNTCWKNSQPLILKDNKKRKEGGFQ